MSDTHYSLEIPQIYEQDQASLGWRTARDQEFFYGQRVAILGTGGAGGGVAESLVREGMQVTLAAPDVFDITNVNRQNGSYLDTVGVNKAEAIARLLRRIRPDIETRVFTDGITPENMDTVLNDLDIIVDALDISLPGLSVEVGRRARALGLPVFMGIEIGLGCSITCFDPEEKDWTVEHYYGLENDQEVNAETEIPLDQILVQMPSYTPAGMLDAFISNEIKSTPGISPGVLILAGTMTAMIERWVLGKQGTYPQFVYPYIYNLDPIDGLNIVHAPDRAEHLQGSLGRMGTNPQSSGFSVSSSYKIIRRP